MSRTLSGLALRSHKVFVYLPPPPWVVILVVSAWIRMSILERPLWTKYRLTTRRSILLVFPLYERYTQFNLMRLQYGLDIRLCRV